MPQVLKNDGLRRRAATWTRERWTERMLFAASALVALYCVAQIPERIRDVALILDLLQ